MTRPFYALVGAVTLILSCSTTAVIVHLCGAGLR